MSLEPDGLPDSDALYENAACGLLLASGDGTILRINTTAQRWIGYSSEEVVGKRRLQDLLNVGGRIFHQTHWAPLLRLQGSVSEVKLDIVHRAGYTIPMIMNAVRHESNGSVFHQVAIFIARDRHQYEQELLIARKRAEEILERQLENQRALSLAQEDLKKQRAAAEDRALLSEQMIGIVSHDLRNPLNAILLGAQLLGLQKLSDDQKNVVERISRSGKRANRLIADLLDFTRIRMGSGLNIKRHSLRLNQFINECVEELSASFASRTLEFVAGEDGECDFDPDRIFQLIGNLVGNAVAYGKPGAPITVASQRDTGSFQISVHNEGEPISEEKIPTLFMPMQRGTEEAGDIRSLGLGLYIVREIAQAHEGEVMVRSSVEDGTTFLVRIPLIGGE